MNQTRTTELNAWKSTIVCCMDRLIQDANEKKKNNNNKNKKNKKKNEKKTNIDSMEWTATTVRFSYWCFRSMGSSDLMREIMYGLCSFTQSSLYGLHAVSIRHALNDSKHNKHTTNNNNTSLLDATHALNMLQLAGRSGENNWSNSLSALNAPTNNEEAIDCRVVAACCLCGDDDSAVLNVVQSVLKVWPLSKVVLQLEAVYSGTNSGTTLKQKKQSVKKKKKKIEKKRKRSKSIEKEKNMLKTSLPKKKKKSKKN